MSSSSVFQSPSLKANPRKGGSSSSITPNPHSTPVAPRLVKKGVGGEESNEEEEDENEETSDDDIKIQEAIDKRLAGHLFCQDKWDNYFKSAPSVNDKSSWIKFKDFFSKTIVNHQFASIINSNCVNPPYLDQLGQFHSLNMVEQNQLLEELDKVRAREANLQDAATSSFHQLGRSQELQ
jgi:hypothetical protein